MMNFFRSKQSIGQFLRYDKSLKHSYPLLRSGLQGFKVEIRKHPCAEAEPTVKDLIGYYPSGEWQILISKSKKQWSVIKSMASFGAFETMRIKPKMEKNPHRFSLLKELIKYLNEK